MLLKTTASTKYFPKRERCAKTSPKRMRSKEVHEAKEIG
jgi:hypothetical protein